MGFGDRILGAPWRRLQEDSVPPSSDPTADPIEAITETTALGAAMLAMLKLGWFESLDDLGKNWALETQFGPKMASEKRDEKQALWQAALQQVLNSAD